MTAPAATVTAGAPLPTRIKLANGFGSIAFGVKDNGFSVFLLIFYNQALGMEAWLVSLALVIALVVDAFVDPLLGNLSDRTYTRWGRRLPWLYLAAIPLGIAWYVLCRRSTGRRASPCCLAWRSSFACCCRPVRCLRSR